ncbi:hypothetical protein [Rhizobium sp. BK176]|uniref:hypothetical protein n=1 Tax=Rhizobium sp. BK176 TaxID=2587071 RepID=UPI002169E49D|nr:hypothetical protein [Rhizobium sp. BK176]MCS4088558.1 hypothetical protein [Rhizobium sp. BK176]
MENPIVTKNFVERLSENIGAKFGVEVSYMDALDLVASSLGCPSDPLMLTLELGGAVVKERPRSRLDDHELTFGALHPSIDQLHSVSAEVADELLELGGRGKGLVLVTGNDGTGKSVLAGALLKGWVANHGGVGVVFEKELEFKSLCGCAGSDGEVVFYPATKGNDDMSHIRSFGQNYLYMGEPLRKQSDFMKAIELAKTRLVVAICSRTHYARMMEGTAAPEEERDTPYPHELLKAHLSSSLNYEITTRVDGEKFSAITTRWVSGCPIDM